MNKEWLGLGIGLALALAVYTVTHWKKLQSDWKSEMKLLLIPVGATAAALLYSGQDPLVVLRTVLTALGVALGLPTLLKNGKK